MASVSLLATLFFASFFQRIVTTTSTTIPTTPTTTTPSTPAPTTPSPEFIDLPDVLEVTESTRPRKVILEFQIASANPDPDVQILSITPDNPVLEDPIVNPTNVSGVFSVQIVLNGSLDYETTNLLTIRLGIKSPSGFVERTFSLSVTDANEPPQCDAHFQLGAVVQVPEDSPAPVRLYTVLAREPDDNDTITFSIYEVQPVSSSAQFHIDDKGSITSNQTFDYERGPRQFTVSVVVTDRQGSNCTGSLLIKVLKVYSVPLDFLLPSQNVTILENEGSESTVTTVTADPNVTDVRYTFIKPYSPFKIGQEDGVIKTSYNLDLESDRTLEKSILLVRAFSMSEDRSGTATVTVYVQDVNEHAPLCVPPVIVLTVPETTEVGRSLGTVRCFDVDVSNQNVTLTVIENSLSLFKFRLQDGQLQVNNSLDYDVADVTNFQYEATILATDSGSPPLTTEVRVLITVTPVNEFDPLFLGPLVIGVPENTRRGSVIASLSAVDRDWPFNSLRYSLLEGEGQFSLDPIGGQLYLGVDLDFEIQDQYELKVKAVDFDQDVDKTKQRTGMAQITIMVENVNDNAPECDPVSYESTIFSTLAFNTPILTLTCTDRDRDHLTATITSGAAVDRFQLTGLTLFSRNVFSFVPDGVYDDTDYEITISVSDGKHSTSVVAYIYVIPWTTTKPTTTTTTTTKNPEVVTVINEFWDPQPWFVAALTVTGALLLLLLSLPLWIKLFRGTVCRTQKPTEQFIQGAETDKQDGLDKPGSSRSSDQVSLGGTISLSKVSIQEDIMRFDGKAQDPVSGRSYLFNSL
ncbi:hypothetical protein AALO_G00140450 [Alosa alosa]|uniref:Cadherin domain-containing protein n=1 Tax=Alosa alosa TaxID=278164 RepID=A0AAV6GLD5_9TELE|nr:cadherin-related family member 4-like [Alosa alosa]KAG5274817.1 hypothetical protein AALO_G00140450 [Alosa alosa]